ncbi:MAG TPA: hypothetical protein ENN67_07975 [Firmicutes bacterium]|nr:hypothetical protein [Bacillota bacterium]
MIDIDALNILADNIDRHAFRRGYVSAFTLTAFPTETDEELSIHVTRESEGLVYGNAEVGTADAFKACIDALDGKVDFIVYDIDLQFEIIRPDNTMICPMSKSVLLAYRDLDVWVSSVKYTMLSLVKNLKHKKCVLVNSAKCHSGLGEMLRDGIKGIVAELAVIDSDENNSGVFSVADIIIGGAVYTPVIEKNHVIECGDDTLIVDAGIGTITTEASDFARQKGMKILRVDNRAAMAGTLISIIQSHDLVNRVMGEGEIDGVPVVAGGIIGAPGTVIVDSIHQPSEVIGIADGTGKVRYKPSNDIERERIEKVRNWILDNGNG